ncbi:MAG: hypothetical protein CMN30_34175 [Sandaracinus sp.]|nr:hypothetical protein [Sandaracinus sp.]
MAERKGRFALAREGVQDLAVRRLIIVAALVLGAAAVALYLAFGSGGPLEDAFARELERRGQVALVSPSGRLDDVRVEGTELVEPTPLAEALAGTDGVALARAMADSGIDALLVEAGEDAPEEGATVEQALAAYRHVPGMRGVYLSPTAALYEPSASAELGEVAEATARVARRILSGTPPPPITSYPEPLRRIRNVEVMVLLRDFGTARLWRSARSSSIAAALNIATTAARQRWRERQQALGGPLSDRLPGLDVEVSILEEDGTLGAVTPAFIERVFGSEHGVAYERPGAWRYLLPDATRREGEGSAVKAYEALFLDNALPVDSLGRRDLRFYRMVVTELGRSTAGGFRDLLPEP